MKLRRIIVVVSFWLSPAAVSAQALSGIAGTVRDTSGGVMPGVTVEAASAALIERVRSAQTDSQGVYRIVDLRPGTYSVTFTLPGFQTVVRTGVELPAAFTATVNAVLAVGGLEETITVSGGAPLVDARGVLHQQTVSRVTLDALPSTRRLADYATLLPGAVTSAQDVGGLMGERGAAFSVNGGRSGDITTQQDGMTLTILNSTTFSWNPHNTEQVSLQTGGISAESLAPGVQVSIVPKDGGNRFGGSVTGAYSNPSLQSGNLTEELQARGLTATPSLRKLYDVGASLGGPFKQNRLWFFSAYRNWAASRYVPGNFWNKLQDSPVGTDPVWRVVFYEPDANRPAYTNDFYEDRSLRLTWQISAKDKFAVSYGSQDNCNCPFDDLAAGGNLPAPEATGLHYYQPNWLTSASWSRPATNRLLFEAGFGVNRAAVNAKRQPGVSDFHIAITELSTNTRYGARAAGIGAPGNYSTNLNTLQMSQRFSVSYITGSHAFKAGVNVLEFLQGHKNYTAFNQINGARAYSFRNRQPVSITLYSTPFGFTHRTLTTGLYAQDQWTVRRLTLNMGVRYDAFNGWTNEQQFPAGLFVPARVLPPVKNSPDWKNINPRVGAAYDLFGTGRTALKGYLGRYVIGTSGNSNVTLNNPATNQAVSATRTWNDANGNYVPDCVLDGSVPGANGECGGLSDLSFGQVRSAGSTRFADEVLGGGLNGSQPYNWQGSLSVQHELRPGTAVDVAYFRTWYGNFRVTDNLAVTPAHYDPYCITVPSDSRLPGSGEQACGFYDIAPTMFGRVDNLVTFASAFGRQTEVYNGVVASVRMRFSQGGVISGGLSIGRTVTDNCFVVDSPQQAHPDLCHVSPPWSDGTQVKFLAVYPLPWDLQASAIYQNISGAQITAPYAVPNAQVAPSLGRNLGACRGAAICNATVTVPLIAPRTRYDDRVQQLDLRLTRSFSASRAKIHANLDLYNALNMSPVLSMVTAYGPRWLDAVQILPGRLLKFGFRVDF
jgi:hypothetical protein